MTEQSINYVLELAIEKLRKSRAFEDFNLSIVLDKGFINLVAVDKDIKEVYNESFDACLYSFDEDTERLVGFKIRQSRSFSLEKAADMQLRMKCAITSILENLHLELSNKV